MWRLAHNAGFYTSSYTTKVNPDIAFILQKLRVSLTRLHEDWEAQKVLREEARARSEVVERGKTMPHKAMQVLMRLRSAYDTASHKSGCELAFPILFGHMCFASHSCWNLFVQKGLFELTSSYTKACPAQRNRGPPESPSVECVLLTAGKRSIKLPATWCVETTPEGNELFKDGDGRSYADKSLAMAAALVEKRARNELDPSDWLHVLDSFKESGDVAETVGEQAALVTSSQYDDWLHRGDHPCVRDLSLYLYSMWVYRGERTVRIEPETLIIPFSKSYILHGSYFQRLATEPRVPKIDGAQIFDTATEKERERAFMLCSLLLRPTRMPDDYANLVEMPDLYADWYDLQAADGAHFQDAWEKYAAGLRVAADECRALSLRCRLMPSIWNTREVHQALQAAMWAPGTLEGKFADAQAASYSIVQYHAMMTLDIYANFAAIGYARLHPMESQYKLDECIPTHEEHEGGVGGDIIDEPHLPTSAADKTVGVSGRPHVVFDAKVLLEDVFTSTHPQSRSEIGKNIDAQFLKGARGLTSFGDVEARAPGPSSKEAARSAFRPAHRARATASLLSQSAARFDFASAQRRSFNMKQQDICVDPADAIEGVEPAPGVPRSEPVRLVIEALSLGARPSEFIARLVHALEHDPDEPKKLTEAQLHFVNDFKEVMDNIKEEDDMGVPWPDRTMHRKILLGEGGSGKSFLVLNIVIPAVAWTFPAAEHGTESFLTVAFSNAQANGLSTESYRAETFHSAGCIRVQSMSHSALRPKDKLPELQAKWVCRMALIIEECFMPAAEAYNMLNYRSSWGRREKCAIDMRDHGAKTQSFGRIPFVLHLGDPLQLQPMHGVGLLDDLKALVEGDANVSVEAETGIKLLQTVKDVYILDGTKRFKDTALPALLGCLRRGQALPAAVWEALRARFIAQGTDGNCTVERRLQEPLFLDGHEVGIFWDTVARWIPRRCRRDAQRLNAPILHCQARDDCSNRPFNSMSDTEKLCLTERLLKRTNIHYTGHMHGVVSLHVGMRVRLTAKLSSEHATVSDAEGCLVDVDLDAHTSDDIRDAWKAQRGFVELTTGYVPAGVWVLMDKF